MTNDRREFLTWAGGAAALAALPGLPKRLSATTTTEHNPLGSGSTDSDWDMSWVQRLTGKYKLVFDDPEHEHGLPIIRANAVVAQYAEVFGTDPSSISSVLVLRHYAIDFAMNDSYWERFKIGNTAGFKNDDGTAIGYNPVRVPNPAIPAPFRAMMLEPFQKSGGIVLACNLALQFDTVPHYVQAGMSQSDAYAAAKADLLPGIILQPSGVFAVGVAQDAGCSYVPAAAGA